MSASLLLTHGCSLSNLPLFVADGLGYFADEGLDAHVPVFTDMSATGRALGSGDARLGTAAFIQPLVDADRDDPPVLVAGSGLMGIAVLARPAFTSLEALRGQRVGTFRGDPLEVLLHDATAAAGLSDDDLDIVHLDGIVPALDSFLAGDLAAITLAEPHASRARAAGAATISDGTELWGSGFPDTVLVAARSLLDEQPDVVRAAIRAMLRAERVIHRDPVAAVACALPHHPDFTDAELLSAAQRQPPCVDVRHLLPAVRARWGSLVALGLAAGDGPPASAIDLSLLEPLVAAGTAPSEPIHQPISH